MEKQGLNELAAAVHENAVAHGWWEQERELPEILMLCVSELAEALEEYRAGKPNIYYNVEGEEILYADGEACEKYERRKPEGVAVELADCMIRILDYCGRAGIDIEEAIRIKHIGNIYINLTRFSNYGSLVTCIRIQLNISKTSSGASHPDRHHAGIGQAGTRPTATNPSF